MTFILRLLIVTLGLVPDPIITRHDVPDDRYIAFADSLEVTGAVIKYNTTDVAGTLIAPEWILSAAHVAETLAPGRKLVTVAGDSVEIESIVIHPGWLEHERPEDIALIRLKRPVERLPIVSIFATRDEVGQMVVIVGNGSHGTGLTGPTENDGRMRAATNRVDRVTDDYLVWVFENPDEHPEATTALEGISGPGDSSGPAFIQVSGKYFLAGISSGQSTKATGGLEGRYGVTEYYTRVSSYVDWIEKTIEIPDSSSED